MKEKKKELKKMSKAKKKKYYPKKNLHPQSLLVIFSPLTWVSVSATQAARITQARSARTASSLPASQPAGQLPARRLRRRACADTLASSF